MIFRLPLEHKTSWEMYVNNLKDRYYRIYKIINNKAYSQTILDNSGVSPYKHGEIVKGDHVYYNLARSQPNAAPKISIRWIGPLEVINWFSESLYEVKLIGDWCKKPHAFCTIVNKLRKVDKNVYYDGLPEKLKARITLPSLLRNFHDTDEDCLVFDEREESPPFKYIPCSVYKTHSSEVREGGEIPLPSSPGRMNEEDVEPNSTPPPLSPTKADSPTMGSSLRGDVPTHPPHTDSTAIDDNASPAVEEDAPRRSSRNNIFRGKFHDGYRRQGTGQKRYP